MYTDEGFNDDAISRLAVKYDGVEWTHIGSLSNPRIGHRSIPNGNTIMHVGGFCGHSDYCDSYIM